MSLKAYDGMMTRKGFKFLQEALKDNLPKFRKAAVKKLFASYAEAATAFADGKDIRRYFELQAINDSEARMRLKEIKIDEDTSLLSYMFQCANILDKSLYKNDFTTQLHLTIEQVGPRLLVYPWINVPEHKKILLSFLEDWYAQNQSDPDDKVPAREWKQREKDWYKFNETKGYTAKIVLFDPEHYWNNLTDSLRGPELIKGITKSVMQADKRMEIINRDKWMSILMDERLDPSLVGKTNIEKYWSARDILSTKEGKKAFAEFSKDNPVEVVRVDEDFLLKKLPAHYRNYSKPNKAQLKIKFPDFNKEPTIFDI